MKNYVGFVNDHSGSMSSLRAAAISDYNANITATKDAASAEMLDTVVSVVGIGIGAGVKRQVVISNPHVLKPVTSWAASGGTPLYTGILDLIALFESLPDAKDENVSFLVISTTDGQATDGLLPKQKLQQKITELQRSGRWTFVFRVPKGARGTVADLNVPYDNIVEWETSTAGMAASTAQTQTAMRSFYTQRSAGAKSSTVFYADAAKVDTSQLVKINDKVSLYVVEGLGVDDGIMIRDFVLKKRAQYLKGAAFYQLTKTEARIGEKKLIAVRDRATGDIFSGQAARTMVNLPQFGNARLHPQDFAAKYDIFIQSESVNRKLVKGTGLLYWEEKGVPFTEEELKQFLTPQQPKPAVPPRPAVVQLPAAPVALAKKTAAPAPSGQTLNGRAVKVFAKRDEARKHGSVIDLRDHRYAVAPKTGLSPRDRWVVYA